LNSRLKAQRDFDVTLCRQPYLDHIWDRAQYYDQLSRDVLGRSVPHTLLIHYFALDFHDPDLYVSTFTQDGVLDYGSGEVKGREAIKEVIARMPSPAKAEGLRPAAARHNISNVVIKVDGNKAAGRSYWFHYSNDNPQRRGVFDGFGHYEDQLVKIDGKWLFAKRKIYNEGRDEWAYKSGKNPAW